MLKRSVLAGLVLAGFASGAFAQAVVPQARPAAQLPMLYDNASQRMLQRQSMTNGDPESNVTPQQYRRARQAAAMIKANHCEEAYNMALAEQDNRLALNIAVACKARFKE